MKTILPLASHRRGFSLVEVLVVIAIIGVLCGIAIPPMMSDDRFKAAKDQRNAQELVALFEEARAAGLDFVSPGDIDKTVENIIRGGEPKTGTFRGHKFALPSLSGASVESAKKYLRLVGDSLMLKNENTPAALSANSNAAIFGKHKKSLIARLA